MHPIRKQRLYIVIFIVLGASVAAALIFYALRENMNLFYSPSDIAAGKAPLDTRIRAGGMVREGSVQRVGDDGEDAAQRSGADEEVRERVQKEPARRPHLPR